MTSDQKFVTKLIIYSGLTLYLVGDLFIWDGFFAKKINDRFAPQTAPINDYSDIIATIYGENITQNQLDQRARELAYRKGDATSFNELPVEKQYAYLLNAQYDLIRETLIRLKTRLNDSGQLDSDKKAGFWMESLTQDFDPDGEEFAKALKSAGMSPATLKSKFQARLNQTEHLKSSTKEASTPTDEELVIYYDQLKDSLKTSDSRSLQHIFFSKLHKDSQSVKTQAEEVLNKLNNGETFEGLAKTYSEDAQSGPLGGNLGFVTNARNDVLPGVDLFNLPNNTPILIESDWGWHIFKASPITKGRQLNFEEAKPLLYSAAKDVRKHKAVDRYVDNILNAARRSNRLSVKPISINVKPDNKNNI